MNNLLEARNLSKSFKEGAKEIKAVNNIDFSIKENEKIVIYGRSGSGKSTLLNLLSGLDAYSEGEISYKNFKYGNQQKKLTQLRKEHMGFVYQFHHLLKEFTSVENVALSTMILGETRKKSMEKASDILNKFGLSERLHHFPNQLSGGEKQRVAMARALINKPDLIFLDEPTGNLDKETSKEVINYLNHLANEYKSSIIVATHDPEFRNFSDKILTMDSGVFV
ncbi:MAG: ABC transporter ATP-binding protein [Gammaproteobacteria bacterium]